MLPDTFSESSPLEHVAREFAHQALTDPKLAIKSVLFAYGGPMGDRTVNLPFLLFQEDVGPRFKISEETWLMEQEELLRHHPPSCNDLIHDRYGIDLPRGLIGLGTRFHCPELLADTYPLVTDKWRHAYSHGMRAVSQPDGSHRFVPIYQPPVNPSVRVLPFVIPNRLERYAQVAASLRSAGAYSIYLGEKVSLRSWNRDKPTTLPFLTLEPHPMHRHDVDLTELDRLARRAPWQHQERVATEYGITPPEDIALFMISSRAMGTGAPYLNERFSNAWRTGWRFRKDGASGYFEVDQGQHDWDRAKGHPIRPSGPLTEFPRRV